MSDAENGYTQDKMFKDPDFGCCNTDEWRPPSDMSETAMNHRRRISRGARDEDTR